MLDIRRHIPMRTVKHWTRSPSEVIHSLSLKVFKTDWTEPWATWSELTAEPALSRRLE